MSDRNLREPNRAFAQTLETMARQLEVLRSRSLNGVARTAREPGVFWTADAKGGISLRAPSGFWLCYVQGTYTAYYTEGVRIGIGISTTPSSSGISRIGDNDWPLATEYLNWTPATDPATGGPYPTERTLTAIGWIKIDEEFTVSTAVNVVGGSPVSSTWYNGRLILIPQ